MDASLSWQKLTLLNKDHSGRGGWGEMDRLAVAGMRLNYRIDRDFG